MGSGTSHVAKGSHVKAGQWSVQLCPPRLLYVDSEMQPKRFLFREILLWACVWVWEVGGATVSRLPLMPWPVSCLEALLTEMASFPHTLGVGTWLFLV